MAETKENTKTFEVCIDEKKYKFLYEYILNTYIPFYFKCKLYIYKQFKNFEITKANIKRNILEDKKINDIDVELSKCDKELSKAKKKKLDVTSIKNKKRELEDIVKEIENTTHKEYNIFIGNLQSDCMEKFNLLKRQYSGIRTDVERMIDARIALKKLEFEKLKTKKKRRGRKITQVCQELTYLRDLLNIKDSKEKRITYTKKTKDGKEIILPHLIKKYKDKTKKEILQEYRNLKGKLFWLRRVYEKTKVKEKKLKQKFEEGKVLDICFGGKKFFRQQYTNKYYIKHHDEWLKEWRRRKTTYCYFTGEKDKKCGNECVQYNIETGNLKFRKLGKDLKGNDKYIEINNLRFKYIDGIKYKKLDEEEKQYYYSYEQAKKRSRAYCFVVKGNRLYMQMSISCQNKISSVKEVYERAKGVIAIDTNYNFLAEAYIQRGIKGYKHIETKTIKLNITNKSRNQIQSSIEQYCSQLIKKAQELNYVIVIEDLHFEEQDKRTSKHNKKTRGKISKMPYAKFRKCLMSMAENKGVLVETVNPSNTSVIGQCKYMKVKGISSHESAAIVIGRRGLLGMENYLQVIDAENIYYEKHPQYRNLRYTNKNTKDEIIKKLKNKVEKEIKDFKIQVKNRFESNSIYRETIPQYILNYGNKKKIVHTGDMKYWDIIGKTLKKEYPFKEKISRLYQKAI